ELGRGCAALAALLESNVEPALAVARWGSAEMQHQIFSELNSGALLAMTHDNRGLLDVRDDGKSKTLRGTTAPVPGAALASHLLVLAGDQGGAQVIALLPKGSATVAPIECSGWRAGAWASWTFADAVIEAG